MSGFGSILSGLGAGARRHKEIRGERTAAQQRLEDRLAAKEMRDLQRQSLEKALNAPPPPEALERVLDEDGNEILLPRSQASGRRVRSPEEPLVQTVGPGGKRIHTPRSQAAGMEAPDPAEPLVQVQMPTGEVRYVPRSQAAGGAAPQGTQAADKQKRLRAATNVQKALDALERNLSNTGSTVMPSSEQAVLKSTYNNALMQMKEAYDLGVLNGPDYFLMQEILSDPTSWSNRLLSYGSGSEQTKRSLAQIAEVRQRMNDIAATVAGAGDAPTETGGRTPTFEEWMRERQQSGRVP